MGTAALLAADRFSTNAEQLSALAVLQLVVYAGMQIPVGLLLDRFGARACLAIGALGMAVGQFAVAFSIELSTAVMGRMLVGLGDAFTFISMIRVINGWYTGKRASQLQQWLGGVGQLGQVLSAFAFSSLIHETTWEIAFLSMSSVGLLVAILVWVIVKQDKHVKPLDHKPLTLVKAIKQLRKAIRLPSTKMAFYTHFSTQSAGTALLLLWGVPFLTKAELLPRSLVALFLSAMVFAGIAGGIWYAHVCAHSPARRKQTVVIAISGNIFAFAVLAIWPTVASLPAIAALLLIIGTVGPSSMIAFDYSKQYVSKSQLGATNGFINIGGFLASFTMMFLIGVALDLHQVSAGGDLYSLDGFRWGFVPVVLVLAFGLWRYLVNQNLVELQSAPKSD